MSNQEFHDLDDFERFVRSTIAPWSPEQRIVVAVSMAERWLPAYEAFYEENEWGDPATLQDAIQSVWDFLLGHKLTEKDRERHAERVNENTPDLEDFDGEEAVAACAMIGWALSGCGNADNIHDAVMAMVCGFEAVAHGIHQTTHWSEIENKLQEMLEIPDEKMESMRERMAAHADDEPTKEEIWHLPHVQNELEKQLKLLKLIGDMAQIDEQHIEALRQKLSSSELVGTVVPRPEPVRGLTNEAIFEQYRRRLEPDLKAKWHWEDNLQALKNTGAIITVNFGEWFGRYLSRKDAIEQGPMLDVAAHDALLARYSTHDAAVQDAAGWDEETRFWIDTVYQNPQMRFDARSPEDTHSYGPSLRRLWIEAKRGGDSDEDLWKSIVRWGRHQPPAWEEETQRKKNRLAYATPELGEHLTRELSWHATGDVDHPWATEVAGETWRVRLNDFPDDVMYTLIINDTVIGKFHDWPTTWQR